MRFDADAQTNAGGRQLNCSKLPRIDRGIPARSAPLGFHFLEASKLPTHARTDAAPSAVVAAVHAICAWTSSSPSPVPFGTTVDAVPPDGALYATTRPGISPRAGRVG